MNNLVYYKDKNPYNFCFLIFLYAIGASSIPMLPEQMFNILSLNLRLIVFFILKLLTVIFPLYIIKSIGYCRQFKFSNQFFKAVIVLFPFLIVCINNFPLVAILCGSAKLEGLGITYLYYAILCFSIAVFEEIIFRGVIYQVIRERKKDFWAIIISSIIFSLAHLVNAFTLNFGALAMQLGYSFLIGAMCSVAYKFSGSIYLPIFLHFIYNFGGLLTNYNLVSGNIWNTASIAVTAILAVATIAYALAIFFIREKNESGYSKG